MDDLERIKSLELENAKLKADNELLLKIISQMRSALDRMVGRFITGDGQ